MTSLSRAVIDALLPRGPVWTPDADSDYDKFLDGIADNSEAVRASLDALRHLRNPWKTPILKDLEREFAVIPSAAATESERRQRLASVMFRRTTLPTHTELESQIAAAGFEGIFVHPNSPAVDPNLFIGRNFNMTCGDLLPGGNDAQCGEPEAYCAQVGGELLVNGDIYRQQPNYTCLCSLDNIFGGAQCGEAGASCGEYDGVTMFPMVYEVPTDPGYWPMLFFVGGPATRNPVTGALTSIKIATVAIERKDEFRRLILRYKPMAAWAALILVWG